MIKKSILIFCMLCLTLAPMINAADKVQRVDQLSEKELNYLYNSVGLNADDLDNFSNEKLREMIENKAVLLTRGPKVFYDLSSEGTANKGLQTMDLTQSDVSLVGYAFSQVSDWSGYNKIVLHGSFDWNIVPYTQATDKISIGYPDNAAFLLRTQNGNIVQHEHAIQRKTKAGGIWETTQYTYQPSDWEPGLGVAGSLTLGATNHLDWKGWIDQSVYVKASSGTTNAKIQYAHSTLGFTPTVTASPSGIGFTPTLNTEVLNYALTVTW